MSRVIINAMKMIIRVAVDALELITLFVSVKILGATGAPKP